MSGTTFDVEAIEAADGRRVPLNDGGFVFARGETAECAFIVKWGRIELREAGRTIEVLGPGEIFGQTSLIDGEPRSTSAVALGPAEVVAIDRPVFHVLFRDDPDFAMAVMRLTARRARVALGMLRHRFEEVPIIRADTRPPRLTVQG
jgi:CRP-like cAMP-binding protein